MNEIEVLLPPKAGEEGLFSKEFIDALDKTRELQDIFSQASSKTKEVFDILKTIESEDEQFEAVSIIHKVVQRYLEIMDRM